ncbi:hypothetical protein H7H37_03870 [Mycolicibacterium insubricum]|nr:hypothetical protein [Mycolicibacterium insubricum]
MLATLVPSMLMLGTFGLDRVESLLGKTDNRDLALMELIEKTRPRALGAGPGTSSGHRGYPMASVLDGEPGLPTRVFRPSVVNPQFQPSRRVDGV